MEPLTVAEEILARLKSRPGDVALQKLLYYVQAWHLAVLDRPLFDEPCQAWVNGPVLKSVFRKDINPRHAALDADTSVLIDRVLAQYGRMTGTKLIQMSHDELPWQEARRDLPASAKTDAPLSTDTMRRYYRYERTLNGETATDVALDIAALIDPRSDETLMQTESQDPWDTSETWANGNLASLSEDDLAAVRDRRRRRTASV